jgi:pimeloyl-ACP methyl ester carboxylesterase
MTLKRLIILSALLFIGAAKLSAQNLPVKTTWEGTMLNIRIILRLSEDSLTREKTAAFDVPQQGAIGLKASKFTVTNDSISVLIAAMQVNYSAAFNADKTEMTGIWKQGAAKVSLLLKRVANADITYKRPQTPKAPFLYQEEKVIYHNKDKSIQYGATLTIPNNAQNVPAVIMITGSGQEDRDEAIFGHKPFWVIADYLTRNGIAVLRVDDRGVGESTGDVINATSADFANDVLVGIDYLKAHKGIDVKNIGLIGHSEGGVIAPMVANQSADVAFIVSMAGVGVKGIDIGMSQLKDAYQPLGFTADESNRIEAFYKEIMAIAVSDLRGEELKKTVNSYITKWVADQPESFLKKARFAGPDAAANVSKTMERLFSPWMRYFLRYDPAATLTKIKIPVLALNGGKDVQVRAKENLEGFSTQLTRAGNKNFKTVLFPNLNHLFQNAKTGAITEYVDIEETVSPEVLDVMTKWILSLKPSSK